MRIIYNRQWALLGPGELTVAARYNNERGQYSAGFLVIVQKTSCDFGNLRVSRYSDCSPTDSQQLTLTICWIEKEEKKNGIWKESITEIGVLLNHEI